MPPGLISAANQTQPLPSSSTWPRFSALESFEGLLGLIHAVADATLGDEPRCTTSLFSNNEWHRVRHLLLQLGDAHGNVLPLHSITL